MHQAIADITDRALLAKFVTAQDGQAFEQLVRRYIDVVYTAARRQAHDPAMAEDVTQTVFIQLARRARSIRDPQALAAWLLRATRYCAANALRQAARRRIHEHKAAIMNGRLENPPIANDLEISETLDAAMTDLSERDRSMIVLRFFREMSLHEAARQLDISEEAAKKRSQRAVAKLRDMLARRGVEVPLAALPAAMARQIIHAPAHLASQISTGSIAAASAKTVGFLGLKSALAGMAVAAIAAITVYAISATAPATKPSATQSTQASAAVFTGYHDPIPQIELRDMTTGALIADATIEISPGYRMGKSNFGKTDASGTATVAIPPWASNQMEISASKAGYVPIEYYWRRILTTIAAPASFSLAMEAGVLLGGTVVNQDGKPIGGATVDLMIAKSYNALHQYAKDNVRALTDASGHWSILGPRDARSIEVGAAHPDYLDSEGSIDLEKADISQLLAGKWETKLTGGGKVHGIIHGPDGKPIKATLSPGFTGASNSDPNFQTSDSGEFEFGAKSGSVIALVISAPGCEMQKQSVAVGQTENQMFSLKPAVPVTITVHDSNAHSIAYPTMATEINAINVVLTGDENGRIFWPEPLEGVTFFNILAPGYDNKSAVAIDASKNHDITLIRQSIISGKVVDAETGKPIKSFRLKSATGKSNEDRFYSINFVLGEDGIFQYSPQTDEGPLVLRAFGDDIIPSDSTAIAISDDDQKIIINAKHGEKITGQLLDIDGKPLSNAFLMLVPREEDLYDGEIYSPKSPDEIKDIVDDGNAFYTFTDADSFFAFPPQIGNYMILGSNEKGYVIAKQKTFDKDRTVQMKPWGKIEGTVMVDGKPGAAGMDISTFNGAAELQDGIGPYCHYSTPTDDKGHFEISKVFAGQYSFALSNPPGEIKIVAGQTAKVEIDMGSRTVVGKVVLPDAVQEQNGYIQPVSIVRADQPRTRIDDTRIQPGGAFSIKGLPEGTYDLDVRAFGHNDRGVDYNNRLAKEIYEFTIPPPEDHMKEVLDIGELQPTGK